MSRTDTDMHVNWMLRNILSFLEGEANEKNIVFTTAFEETLPTITTDGAQVQQLLLAVVEDTLAAIGADGRVDFITFSTPARVHIQIADSSPGVTSARMNKLWQPTPVDGGAGREARSGLSVYGAVVYRLGGRISVQDRPQGGMLFTLSLPVRG